MLRVLEAANFFPDEAMAALSYLLGVCGSKRSEHGNEEMGYKLIAERACESAIQRQGNLFRLNSHSFDKALRSQVQAPCILAESRRQLPFQ